MKLTRCDICEIEIEKESDVYNLEFDSQVYKNDCTPMKKTFKFDLCDDCATKLSHKVMKMAEESGRISAFDLDKLLVRQ